LGKHKSAAQVFAGSYGQILSQENLQKSPDIVSKSLNCSHAWEGADRGSMPNVELANKQAEK